MSRRAGVTIPAMESVLVGISGARRNPAAAVASGGRLLGFCEQERLTRIRGVGLRRGQLPEEAVAAVLKIAGRDSSAVHAYVTAEEGVTLPEGLPRLRLDHHHCHAATAFLTSSFERAAILVCDRNSSPEVSVWLGEGRTVTSQQWPWLGHGFATLFTQCAEVFGFAAGQEHRLESLARLDSSESDVFDNVFRYADGALQVAPGWKRLVADQLLARGGQRTREQDARVAGAFQRALGAALAKLTASIRAAVDVPHLCLAGGLFYNTFFNTIVSESRDFDEVFVPPNPGNTGNAAGAALAASRQRPTENGRQTVSAFLGPQFHVEEVKQTLDNCKLSYEFLGEDLIIERTVKHLLAGRLVGWFQGSMEWGHRALGNRSILASPFSPYVLDNLNVFLKQRERERAYGLSVREHEAAQYFLGPRRSAWMEYDFRLKDPELFRHVTPAGATSLRVQTIDAGATLFSDVHRAFAAASGTGVLVNTSFNGFSEPIVCSPRDAIRVFYGTGLDVLVLGRFVIEK